MLSNTMVKFGPKISRLLCGDLEHESCSIEQNAGVIEQNGRSIWGHPRSPAGCYSKHAENTLIFPGAVRQKKNKHFHKYKPLFGKLSFAAA